LAVVVASQAAVREEGSDMARMSLQAFADQIAQGLGTRLVTLLLYGSAARQSEGGPDPGGAVAAMNTLLIVSGSAAGGDGELFGRLVTPVRSWVAAGHPPPLIMTEREWRDSADAFPVEYQDIREAHRVLAGRDPWQGISMERDHVRRQLEHELMGKLMHLRQAYAADWNNPKRLGAVVQGTRAGFLTMLRAVLRLAGRAAPAAPEALVREAGALIGFAADRLTEPVAYLDAVTRTAEYVNRMERNSS
jgi:hypothetical protein